MCNLLKERLTERMHMESMKMTYSKNKKQKAKISLSLLFQIEIMHSNIVDDHRDIIEDIDRGRIFDLDKKKTRMSSCRNAKNESIASKIDARRRRMMMNANVV